MTLFARNQQCFLLQMLQLEAWVGNLQGNSVSVE